MRNLTEHLLQIVMQENSTLTKTKQALVIFPVLLHYGRKALHC